MKKRLTYIDLCKEVGILLITFFHIATIRNGFYEWASLFMVSIFFVVSGYMISYNKKELTILEATKKLAYQLGIPYLFFSLLAVMYDILLKTPDVTVGSIIGNNLKLFFSLRGVGNLGFLPVLFVCELLVYVVLSLKKNKDYFMLGLGGISLLIGIILQLVIKNDFFTTKDSFFIYLLLFLLKSMSSVFFVVVGYYFEKYHEKIPYWWANLVAGLVCIGFTVALSKFSPSIEWDYFVMGNKLSIIYYLGSIIASIGFIMLFSSFESVIKDPLIGYFGRISLVVMASSFTNKFIFFAENWYDRLIETNLEEWSFMYGLRGAIVLVMVLGMASILDILLRCFIPFVLGKTKEDNFYKETKEEKIEDKDNKEIETTNELVTE